MLRHHPKLLLLGAFIVGVLAPAGLSLLFGGGYELWCLLCCLPWTGVVALLCSVVRRLELDLEQADYKRRLGPVKQSLRACGMMAGKELQYRNRVVRQVLDTLKVVSKAEAPLPTGTRVDAYMEFGDEDWYITIKRGLNNQKRLILQGEIEDIILHAPRKDRDLWICVVVGLSKKFDAQEISHAKHLWHYALCRSLLNARVSGPRVNIEVMHAIIPSSPVEDGVGAGTGELVPA